MVFLKATRSWQTINYKAQPEKLVPAKDAYTSRRLSIKELPKKD